jgi:hypothetical protein
MQDESTAVKVYILVLSIPLLVYIYLTFMTKLSSVTVYILEYTTFTQKNLNKKRNLLSELICLLPQSLGSNHNAISCISLSTYFKPELSNVNFIGFIIPLRILS